MSGRLDLFADIQRIADALERIADHMEMLENIARNTEYPDPESVPTIPQNVCKHTLERTE
jgi:hypothetical protein